MRLSLLGFFILCLNTLAFGQQGTLAGKVTDKKAGEGVIGATVLVTGTTQAAPVDVDGSYTLPLDPGTYNITMTYVGYQPLTFAGIVITSGQTTTLNGVMQESATSLTEVTVTGVKQTGTEVALIQDLKKSEVVVSGMSSDQIVKSLDRDAAEVVKRIPGVTVQSNNFIVIRGLAERYNTVLLNDALTPSAEVDTRSFSFDILPSSVIDRVLIFKSGSPELPGEFGGGVVKVYTKNSVLENTTSLTVSGWYRSGTTFDKNYMTSARSKTDGLGFDSGSRELPKSFSGYLGSNLPADQQRTFASQIRNTWLPTIRTASPDLRVSLGLTRKYEIGSVYLSNVTSLSYSNTHEQFVIDRGRFSTSDIDPTTNQPVPQYLFKDERAVTGTRVGVIHNWQARLNDRNRIEFHNFLNQYGTDEVVHRTGEDFNNLQERDEYALHYQSRTIYSGQLKGTHTLGQTDHTTVTWAGGYNYVYRDEPDYSRYRNGRTALPGRPFVVNVSQDDQGSLFNASRFFSTLKENTYMGSGQWERRFLGRDTTKAAEYKLRVGFYAEQKERNLQNRYFSFNRGPQMSDDDFNRLTLLPINEIFAPQNLNPTTGFVLREGTQGYDRYDAENSLVAGYVSVVAPLTEKLNISGGVRVEYNRKFLRSGELNVDPYLETRVIPMPSINTTFNFNDRSLLRVASSITVNRPEFREVANYPYFDFTTNAIVTGNPALKTATIYNADLRYEFYPSRSELISAAVFYKHFRNAIEQTTQQVSPTQLYLTYANAAKAYDLGAEVEVRKSLVELTENPLLQRLSLVFNASLIRSQVSVQDSTNSQFALGNRPLQGQSPYVVNAGVFYQDIDGKLQISAQYNVIGQRLTFVGDQQFNYSVIEMPRHVFDLSVTKGIGQHLQIKAGIQDLLNQSVRQFYDFDRNNKIDGNERQAFGRYNRGSYSTLGLTYNF